MSKLGGKNIFGNPSWQKRREPIRWILENKSGFFNLGGFLL
jgi:hypothetical protein